MKWLLCVQSPYNSIRYITDELQEYSSHSYNKFLEMIMNLKPFDPNGLKEAIDGFKTIYFDVNTHVWHIENYVLEENIFTSKQMHELNPSPEILEEQKKNDSIINHTKNLIDSMSKEKVNKNITKFRDKGKTDDRTKKRY